MGLVHHHQAPSFNWSPEGEESTHKVEVNPPMALPGRHPSVEKALDGMSGDLQDLKDKQMAAKQTRKELEGKVGEAVSHMNDAMSIKHAISKKEAELRVEANKLRFLEREASHLEETHSSLVNSLHRVLEPKLQYARDRLEKKEMILKREAATAKGWQDKKDQLHEHALQILKEKKASHQSLLEAEHEVAEAKHKEEVANKRYREERQMTAQEIQSFRYAETRFKAEVTHEKAAEEAAIAARESVKKLNNVLEVEAEKVEESMEATKNRIHQKMAQLEGQRQKVSNDLNGLQHKYAEWKESERQRAAEVVKKGQDTVIAAEDYAEKQKQVLESAQAKVANEAVSKSDWAWENGSDQGFVDDNPSLD